MIYGETTDARIQEKLDADRFGPSSATLEAPVVSADRDGFRMLGLFGVIPGSSYEPIHVECWSRND